MTTDPAADKPRSLAPYCARGCGREATTHSRVRVHPDEADGFLVTSMLLCSECAAEVGRKESR